VRTRESPPEASSSGSPSVRVEPRDPSRGPVVFAGAVPVEISLVAVRAEPEVVEIEVQLPRAGLITNEWAQPHGWGR